MLTTNSLQYSRGSHWPRIDEIITYATKYRHIGQEKFTCQACYESKVKCSREKPHCERCRRTNRKCRYIHRIPERRVYTLIADLEQEMRLKNFIQADHLVPVNDLISFIFNKKPPSGLVCNPFLINRSYIFEANQDHWDLMRLLLGIHRTTKSGPVHLEIVLKLVAFHSCLKSVVDNKKVRDLECLFQTALGQDIEEYYNNFISRLSTNTTGGIKQYMYSNAALDNFRQFKHILALCLGVPPPDDAPIQVTPLMPILRPLIQIKTPQLLIRIDSYDITSPNEINFAVHGNAQFRMKFGLDDKTISERLRKEIVGFLPYSVPGIALLASDFQELLKFAQVQCTKGFNFDYRKNPILNETMSVDILTLNSVKHYYTKQLVPVKYKVVTTLRQLRSFTSFHDEIYYKFMPVSSQIQLR